MRPVFLIYLALSTALLGCDEASHPQGPAPQAAGEGAAGEAEASSQAPRSPAGSPQRATAPQDPAPNAPHSAANPDESAPPRPPAAGVEPDPLALETHLQAEGDSWALRWRVTNHSPSPIYLVTQVPSFRAGRQVPAPGAIYRRAEDETLYLTKRLWRIPAAVDALVPALPYLIRLDPGQSHVGGVRIPAAIRESYPYQDGHAAAQVQRLVVSFGYFESASPCAEHPGLYQVPYSALDQQRYLTSEPLAARLVVR